MSNSPPHTLTYTHLSIVLNHSLLSSIYLHVGYDRSENNIRQKNILQI